MKSFLFLAFFLTSHVLLASEFLINVPRSNMTIREERVLEKPIPGIIEFSTENWAPSNFSEDSRLPGTLNFSQGSMPQLSLNRLVQFKKWSDQGLTLSSKFGGSYAQLQRTGQSSNSDFGGGQVNQTLNVWTLRAGLELSAATMFSALKVTTGVSLAPRFAQATSSEFNDGISDVRNAWEANLGLTYDLPGVAQTFGFQNLSLELGAESTRGLGADLSATGLYAGLRIQ